MYLFDLRGYLHMYDYKTFEMNIRYMCKKMQWSYYDIIG